MTTPFVQDTGLSPDKSRDLTRPTEQLQRRYRTGRIWQGLFFASTTIGIIALLALLVTIINQAFGYTAVENQVDPATLSNRPLEELSHDELAGVLVDNLSQNRINTLEREKPFISRSRTELYNLVVDRVVEPKVVESWTLLESLWDRRSIQAAMSTDYPQAELQFRSWFSLNFLMKSMSPKPELAGVRTALLGSLWIILITIVVAFPVGVGAAIYLEEYAGTNRINRIIQTNIDNLAGVPSIVYGILGLAVFVRGLQGLTSGAVFGGDSDTGRTVLSAGLTLALLILPVLIINAQEAIRAVPGSLRQASYGLGATRWQTIWNHVLPSALPGILTGTILAVSRAIGETAPLIVVGASTFITSDPSGPFSQFTALPIQIYNWTTRPQDEFRNIAAAAILVLLISLLTLNAAAILLRNRFSRRIS